MIVLGPPISPRKTIGLLLHCADDIRSALPMKHGNGSESDEEYQPLTPPLSDYADDSLPLPSNIATLLISEQSSHEDGNWARKRRVAILDGSGKESSAD